MKFLHIAPHQRYEEEEQLTEAKVKVGFAWSIPVRGYLYSDYYKALVDTIDEAEQTGASAIILSINSNGGEVGGMYDVAESVRETSLPVLAMIEGACNSAAYGIACNADVIGAQVGSLVGSVGTVAQYYKDKEIMSISNSEADLKDVMTRVDMKEEQLAYVKQMLDDLTIPFQELVETARPNINQEYKRGGSYESFRAGSMGFVDAVGRSKEIIGAFLKNNA
jgi:ClpP class serine protease